MGRNWHRAPSLNTLRVFEATARLLSFTRAAIELHVTQAAVSRQIRQLESALGKPLFVRLHRRIELTASGRGLAEDDGLINTFQSGARRWNMLAGACL